METKEMIIELLKSTNRPGMDNLIEAMEEGGFFTAPCSGGYHLAREGGLAEHSLNVLNVAMDTTVGLFKVEPLPKVSRDRLIIVCLLHDLGKMGQSGKANYVQNTLKSGKQSVSKPYKTNPDLLYVDHEVRSVVIAQQYIELTEEEQQAILWHNGLYGNFRYQIQGKETALYMILHFADMWASRIMEVDNENN